MAKKKRLPTVDLDPLPEADGQLGPYAISGLKTASGTRRNPRALDTWYKNPVIHTTQSPIVTAYHPLLKDWLRIIGGFDPYWRGKQTPQSETPFARVVARVEGRKSFPTFPIPKGTYWFDYSNFTDSTNRLPEVEWGPELPSRLPEGSTSIMGCITGYKHRAALWKFRDLVWSHPIFQAYDGIASPDFGSFLNDPYPQQTMAERMAEQWINLGFEHDLNIIPTISFQDEKSLRRQTDFLGSLYPDVHTVHLEFAAVGVDKTRWMFSRRDLLEQCLAYLPTHFLISGVQAGWMIRELREVLPSHNFSVVTLSPWSEAVREPLIEMKSRVFRKRMGIIEDYCRGEHLPPPKLRPEDGDILLEEDVDH